MSPHHQRVKTTHPSLSLPLPLSNSVAASASSARESPSKTAGRRRSSASQRSPGVLRHSKSTNNISDLEVLGLTVQSINAALSSGAVREGTGSPVRSPMGPDGAARSGEAQPYILSGAKFHPRGCVWDVSIQVS